MNKKIVEHIEKWFQRHQRPLPWRKKYLPYQIWISECMLQQTTIKTVLPYFVQFMKTFPTVKALANASSDEVMQMWAGLGYYSRARNLHKAAQEIVENHEGLIPSDTEKLKQLSGVGPYTCGAIASIAYNKRAPIVDGNVMRVFSRIFNIKDPINRSKTQNKFWKLSEELVTLSKSPRYFNQGLMELGALICKKNSPECSLCPIKKHCVSYNEGTTHLLPKKDPKKPFKKLYWLGILEQDPKTSQIFLRKQKKSEWWTDLYQFPYEEFHTEEDLLKKKEQLIKKKQTHAIGRIRHTVTHHKISVDLITIKQPLTKSKTNDSFNLEDLPAISSLTKKALTLLE